MRVRVAPLECSLVCRRALARVLAHRHTRAQMVRVQPHLDREHQLLDLVALQRTHHARRPLQDVLLVRHTGHALSALSPHRQSVHKLQVLADSANAKVQRCSVRCRSLAAEQTRTTLSQECL